MCVCEVECDMQVMTTVITDMRQDIIKHTSTVVTAALDARAIFTVDTIVLEAACKIGLPRISSFHNGSMINAVTEATIKLCYLKVFPH